MTDRPRIILVDQDNVIADQFGLFHARLKEQRPDIYATYRGSDHEFQFEKNFDTPHTEEIWNIRREKGFFRALTPIPGAIQALNHLESVGCEVFIVTAPIRTPHSASEKLEWIASHLGDAWVHRTILTRDKTLVQGDVLIDDNPRVAGVCTPPWEHILFDQPYHQDVPKRRLNWENYREILDL